MPKVNKLPLILAGILGLAALVGVAGLVWFSGQTVQLPLDVDDDGRPDFQLSFQTRKTASLILIEEKNIPASYLNTQTYLYQLSTLGRKTGELQVVLQQVEQKDYLFFVSFTPEENRWTRALTQASDSLAHRLPAPLGQFTGRLAAKVQPLAARLAQQLTPKLAFRLQAHGPGDLLAMRETGYQEAGNIFFAVSEASPDQPLPNKSRYLDFRHSSLWLSQVELSQDLGFTVKEYAPLPQLTWETEAAGDSWALHTSLPALPGYTSSLAGTLSREPLVNWADEEAVAILKRLDLAQGKKLWPDGLYYPVPHNYLPRGENSYYRIASAWYASIAADAFHQGRLFHGLALSSLYAFLDAYNQQGYIPTAPQSQWLAEAFGIGAYFYDTRFNSDTAMALVNIYRHYPEQRIINCLDKYFAFFTGFALQHGWETKNGGLLIPDYLDASGVNQAVPHASLNHLLAEMNVIYMYHQIKPQEDLLALAHRIKQAVIDTGPGWIKENHDLWYAVTPDQRYVLPDYPFLTYDDLRIAQEYFTLIDGGPEETFRQLIASKEKYLRENNLLD